VCRLRLRLLDSPLFHIPCALFPCARAVLPTDRSPDRFRVQVHSSVLSLLFRVPSLRIPPPSFRTRLPAWVSSLFATPSERVHSPRGFPSPRYVPSSGALSLPTSYSALRLAGLLHPAATSRALLVQGLLSRRSHPSSSEGAPPSPLVTQALIGRNRCPRWASSTSRSFSASSSVPSRPAVSLANGRSPLRVSSPPGLSCSPLAPVTQGAPLMKLSNVTFACALVPSDLLQRLPTNYLGLPVSESTDLPENFEPISNPSALRLLGS
jgi:hypothetical protein